MKSLTALEFKWPSVKSFSELKLGLAWLWGGLVHFETVVGFMAVFWDEAYVCLTSWFGFCAFDEGLADTLIGILC
jgi:hypothetical protein